MRRTAWLLLVLAGAAGVASGWTTLVLPSWVPQAGAVAVTSAYALGLTARTGGRPLLFGALALALAAGAVLSGVPVLLSAAAVSTAVLGAVLGVMSTSPAARFPAVIWECLVATLVAVVAGFASEAYDAPLSVARVEYVVLGLTLLGAIAVVYRLGAGLRGLGGRGTVAVLTGVALLAAMLAYSEALARWGSPGLVQGVRQTTADLRATVGAVPRPIEVLLGFPALAWGVSTRARRRQGWWLCAFGAAGLSVVTVSLLNPRVSLTEAGLRLLYGFALGMLVGYLVIRADSFLTGTRGRGARRAESAAAHRPEPGRTHALL